MGSDPKYNVRDCKIIQKRPIVQLFKRKYPIFCIFNSLNFVDPKHFSVTVINIQSLSTTFRLWFDDKKGGVPIIQKKISYGVKDLFLVACEKNYE